MKVMRYKNLGRNSSVKYYDMGDDWIAVYYKDYKHSYYWEYVWTCVKSGDTHVERMKKLAMRGVGLNSYIHQHVETEYVSKRKVNKSEL